jgi:catechol 2,3-dioxygenase-like lactoylglutathione lyase family enzyme
VRDTRRAAAFYHRVFGFQTLLEQERIVALDVGGRSVLLLFKEGATQDGVTTPGGVIPGHDGSGPTHFAFAVSAAELPAWREKLAAEGVAIESEVKWPGGAESVYFRDLDNHLVELITPGFWRTY